MSRHRFFLVDELPAISDDAAILLPLAEADLHHAVSVLRVRAGEEIDVVAPGGRVWRVIVDTATRDALTAVVAEELREPDLAAPRVTLVFGVSKGSKNDEIVEGAVEVGAWDIVPVLTARSVVRFDSKKRADRGERWRRVALTAAKQSKRGSVPHVSDPARLNDVLPLLGGHEVVLVAWEDADAQGSGVRAALAAAGEISADARVAVVVGPEGGLAPEEVEALSKIGGRTVTLGRTILRAETAAVVATALVIHEVGGMGNAR